MKIKKIIQDIRFKILISLLKKYSNTELDQWERWEISSKYGKVYITISREATGTNYVKID